MSLRRLPSLDSAEKETYTFCKVRSEGGAAVSAVRRLDYTVPEEAGGVRVDTLLRTRLHLSGTVIRRIKWLEDGILVDGTRVNTRFVPRPGQVLSVRLSDPERRSGVAPRPGELDVVYEDGDVIVLNKAPGVCVHPGPGHYDDTIGNFLLDHFDRQEEGADFHPIHRLDRGTSGLLVCAKHAHAQERLKRQLHTPQFRRVYLAVCQGRVAPASGVVDAPLAAKPGSLVEQRVDPAGKSARTRYETVRGDGDRTLVRLELDTGRTHQIRVHMAHLGYPLVGDFLYGIEQPDVIARPALHSFRMEFVHPVTERLMAFERPLPQDMERLI